MTILATLWKTLGLGGSVAVALGIALTVCWFGWDRAALQRDVAEGANTVLAERLATSNSSIDRLQGVIEANNEAARQRNEAYENSLRIARERANENERRAVASNAKIARLEALAGEDGVCAIPSELLAEIEGL